MTSGRTKSVRASSSTSIGVGSAIFRCQVTFRREASFVEVGAPRRPAAVKRGAEHSVSR